MEIPGIWVVFSYFNTIIGPTAYFAKPPLEDTIKKRITALMEVEIENTQFDHNFQDIFTYNYNFALQSSIARGGQIDCMVTIGSDTPLDGRAQLDEACSWFIPKIRDIPKLDALLADKLPEEQARDAVAAKLRMLMEAIYDQVKCLSPALQENRELIVPGFFSMEETHSPEIRPCGPYVGDVSPWFAKPLALIFKKRYAKALSTWDHMERQAIAEGGPKIRDCLLGSFAHLQQSHPQKASVLAKKAFGLAESAFGLAHAPQPSSLHLLTDTLLQLLASESRISMVMVFETAFREFDAQCGLSEHIMGNIDWYIRLFSQVTVQLGESQPERPDTKIRLGLALSALGKLKNLQYKGDPRPSLLDEAISALETSFSCLRSYPLSAPLIENRVSLSIVYETLHDEAKALQYLAEALDIAAKAPAHQKPLYRAWVRQRRGWIYFHQGKLDESLAEYQQSLAGLKSVGLSVEREVYVGKTKMRIGYIASFQKGNFTMILELYQEAMAIFRNQHEDLELSRLLYITGDLYKSKGKLAKALEYYERSGYIAQKIHDDEAIGISLARKAKIMAEMLHFDEALVIYFEALPYFQRIHHPQFLGITYGEIGSIFQALNLQEKAVKYYSLGLESFRDEGNELESFWILYKLTTLFAHSDRQKMQFYANKLMELSKEASSDVLVQAAKISEAIVLGHSPNARDRLKATFLLEQVVDEKVIQHQLTHAALTHLCEFLLLELHTAKAENLVSEIGARLHQLIAFSEEINRPYEQIRLGILHAKIAMLKAQWDTARQILAETQEKAAHQAISRFQQQILADLSFIESRESDTSATSFESLPIDQRLQLIQFEVSIQQFIRDFNF